MKNIYSFIEEIKNEFNCEFCFDKKTATYSMNTRRKADNRLLASDMVCDKCKEKINLFKKCSECERIFRKGDDGVCKCEYLKSIGDDENTEIKFKPSPSAQLEKQLYELSLENEELEEELQTEQEAHLAGIDATANWYKREFEKEKEALLTKIKKLETEIERLRKLAENCNCQIVEAKIEVPPKSFNL